MGQRSIALDLSMKGLSAKAMGQDLVQTLVAKAVACSTATRYFRAAKFPAQRKEAPDEAGLTRTESVDAAILKASTDNPFSSGRQGSQLT
jgi:hypothetical protein